jgi:hypothetical protein
MKRALPLLALYECSAGLVASGVSQSMTTNNLPSHLFLVLVRLPLLLPSILLLLLPRLPTRLPIPPPPLPLMLLLPPVNLD